MRLYPLILILVLLTACSNIHSTDPDLMTEQEKQLAIDNALQKNPFIEITTQERDVDVKLAQKLSSAKTIAKGNFQSYGYATEGAADIKKSGNTYYLVLNENFHSRAGPSLYVYLAENPTVQDANDLKDGRYLALAKLKSTQGIQVYEIPDATNATLYKSVSIYCRDFKTIFGSATLNPTPQ